ncbi:MerR family transcriptional regulator [Tropheryma whipplei]|uniref:MerR family transcriptional regulator n=1 Tax=Tropheryma whipplei TaxID=2039 RepID=UPI0004AD357A|nr:helix-turn-helix transcriptional regulator [Tropheryma whipplei]MCO8182442.1 helix-turn-helix transcriptional regulator [Tropheryma whipplei]
MGTPQFFTVTVAAALSGMHPQTLRKLDRLGLLSPKRTLGGDRRYTAQDVEGLRAISSMVSSGLTLEGIKHISRLEKELASLKAENHLLRQKLKNDRQGRIFAAGQEIVTLEYGTRIKRGKALIVWREFHV